MTTCAFPSYICIFFFPKWFILRVMKQALQTFEKSNFCCPTFVGQLLNNCFKVFLWILHFVGGISVIFLRKKKSEICLNFSSYHYQRFSRIFGRKWEIVKSAVSHKSCMQLDNLFRPTVIHTLNPHQFWRIRSTCITKLTR